MDIFAREYPEWNNFIGCNYPMFEFGYISEEEIISDYFGGRGVEKSIEAFFEEGDRLLTLAPSDFPWQIMSALGAGPEISPLSFDKVEDWQHWTRNIIDMAHAIVDSSTS